jgi:hypothetical protein
MSEEIKALLSRMHETAEEAFHGAARFGKGSAQHMSLIVNFADASRAYEAACRSAGREPYATYSED